MKYVLITACLLSSSAQAATVCSVEPANDVLDILQVHAEVPILSGVMGDEQIKVVASPDGKFMVLVLSPTGEACILAAGEALKTAKPDERFAKETAQ